MNIERIVVDTNEIPWMSLGEGIGDVKVLRLNEDFSSVELYRAYGGVVAPSHIHVGPIEVLFLSGQAETVAGPAGEGFGVLEPAGAMHKASQIYTTAITLNHTYGPTGFLGADGSAPPVVYGQMYKSLAGGGMHLLSPAELAEAMYPEDYNSCIIDTNAMDWMPSGYDGVSIKVLKIFENGHFTMMVKGDDGSSLPPRYYSAPADYYVISGCMRFDGEDAKSDHWVYQPMGSHDDPVTHIGETIYLATCAGAIIDLSADGRTARKITDGVAVQQLMGGRSATGRSLVPEVA